MSVMAVTTEAMAIGQEPALVLEHVSKSFGGLWAVQDVSITVKTGEKRAIIGPNGAGKTTLFNLISGELCPTSGKVYISGVEVTREPAHFRVKRGLARTFQVTNLFFDQTVLENVILALLGVSRLRYNSLTPLKRFRSLYSEAGWLLEKLNLNGKQSEKVKNLSYGDQRLLEVVLALASKPRIIALDEPTAGLAGQEVESMVATLSALEDNVTLILIEHDIKVAFDLCNWVAVMHDGQKIADGPVNEVKANPKVQEIYLGTGGEDNA